MRKTFTCLFSFSVMVVLASSQASPFEFVGALNEWIFSHHYNLNLFDFQEPIVIYIWRTSPNETCTELPQTAIQDEMMKGFEKWSVNNSKIGEIAMFIVNVAYPAYIRKLKLCTDEARLRRDETNFTNLLTQVLEQNPELNEDYKTLQAVNEFLLKGELSRNETCVYEYRIHREIPWLYGAASVGLQHENINETVKNFVYNGSYFTSQTSQRCLKGSNHNNFDAVTKLYLNRVPSLKKDIEEKTQILKNLTTVLPHDEQCAKRVTDGWHSDLQTVYSYFGNGTYSVPELTKLVSVEYLPKRITEAKACLRRNFLDWE